MRQERFIEEYLIDFNASRAAIAAGYSSKNAKSQGWRLLADPEIQAELTKRKDSLTESLKITQEKIVHELAMLGFSNIFDYIYVDDNQEVQLKSEIQPDKQKAVTSIKVGKGNIDIKLGDKLHALELLAKYVRLFDTAPDQNGKENNFFEALKDAGSNINFDNIPEMKDQSGKPE